MKYEKKFTPGPWVIGEDKDIITKQDIKGDVICLQPGFVGLNESQKYWEHNAHLIAAAPELLDALIQCKELLSLRSDPFSLEASLKADQAINKSLNIKNDEL